MALVIPEGFGQAVYRFALTGDSEEMLTTIGVAMVGAFGTGQGAADTLRNDFVFGFPAASICIGYTFLGVRFLEGHGAGPSVVFESTAAPLVGANAGPALPPNCAFLIQKRTGVGGRANRGRMYLPAFALGEDSVPVTGVMLEAQRVVIQAKVDAAFGTGDRVILHDSATPGALEPTLITSLNLTHRLATQRRRLRP